MLILALIALVVIPPDKLPEVTRQLARFLNDLRRSTSGIWDDLKQDAMSKPVAPLKNNMQEAKEAEVEKQDIKQENQNTHEENHGHGDERKPHE